MTYQHAVYIGTSKAGSTWLYEALRVHPEIRAPRLKDPFYFDRYYGRGYGWYLGLFGLDLPTDCQKCSGETAKVLLDVSHDYMYCAEAPARIDQLKGGCRLACFLRDPTERAISVHRYLLKFGMCSSDFWTAARNRPEIIQQGHYVHYLSSWKDHLGSGRLKVWPFESVRDEPWRTGREICAHLGVDPDEFSDPGRVVNAAQRPRSRNVARIAKGGALAARRAGMVSLLGWAKQNRALNRLLFTSAVSDASSESIRRELRPVFAASNTELASLLGDDHYLTWLP